jgi:hypothetical protein
LLSKHTHGRNRMAQAKFLSEIFVYFIIVKGLVFSLFSKHRLGKQNGAGQIGRKILYGKYNICLSYIYGSESAEPKFVNV